jgi:NADH dehydrogenase
MTANIPDSNLKRIIIVGGGFGGLKLARTLAGDNFQVVLIDKINYHQFQPLFYQVATAGLEPSTISFPFRKIFQKTKNICIRVAHVTAVDPDQNCIHSDIGTIGYDFLVLAIGADTNYFGNQRLMDHALPMKSVTEALAIRNRVLENYEEALSTENEESRKALMSIVVVGGGPTGVELSGTLAEMKKYILPKDFPELDFKEMKIYLLEASPRLLNGMSDKAGKKSRSYLEELGVEVMPGTSVKDYDGEQVFLENGAPIKSRILIWAAGVKGNTMKGIPPACIVKGNRIKVDRMNRMEGSQNIFAIGDIASMSEDAWPNGHPQVAQVAIQQAANLAGNFKLLAKNASPVPFHYKDLGSMATVGRNKAVADLPFMKFQGFIAWVFWMFVHLMSIVGVKNRLFIFINWAWSYMTYDQSLRLIIRPEKEKQGSSSKP